MVDIHFQASQCLVGPVKERKETGGNDFMLALTG